MSNIIPFESSALPAHLAHIDVAAVNADLTAHAGGGFPVISIKGKVFAIVRDGERVVLPNPKDPESAATSIEVVLVKANKATSKTFYAAGYDPAASGDAAKPDCYSADGSKPAADAKNPQSKTCATCKHNEWGSKVNEKGVATKGKACQDLVRMAVVPNGQLNDPHLLRVPAASIRNLGEYGTMLAKRGVAYDMVVTKIGFDMDAESPKLTFKATGFLPEADYAAIQATKGLDTVSYILDSSPAATDGEPPAERAAPAEPSKPAAPAAKEAPAEPAPAPAPKPRAAAKPRAETPAPAPKPAAVEEDPDLDLDGIDFDD